MQSSGLNSKENDARSDLVKHRILDRLPYRPKGISLQIPSGDVVEFRSYQIVVWAAITHATEDWARDDHPLFPCIVDTGTNRGFFLRESHLREWAGIDDPLTPAPSSGGLFAWHPLETPIPIWRLHTHKVWLFPNLPGSIEVDLQETPYDLHIEPVFLPARPVVKLRNKKLTPPDGPRVPVLGLPAFERRRLHLHIDAGTRTVSLRE